MSTVDEQAGTVDVPARVVRPPAPGAESAGPAMVELVQELAATRRTMDALVAGARVRQAERLQSFTALDQADTNGDALLELFSVPSGSAGHLMLCTVDEAATTPAAPDTGAGLWLAIYAAASAGISDPAQVAAVGAMLDCLPQTPSVNAQIPCSFYYGDRDTAPLLRGPATFYLVIDGATASVQVAARGQVLVRQLDPN